MDKLTEKDYHPVMNNHNGPRERAAHEYDLGRSEKNDGLACLYIALGVAFSWGCLAGWLLHIGWKMWWLV